MKSLSVVVLTCNNADIIARFVRSVAWADELVVVDSGSTDETRDIAHQAHANCRVLVRDLDCFGSQRNFGLEQASGDWVMHCDSDHVVPPALRDEIQEILGQESPPYRAYNVFQNLYWRNRLLSHASGPCGFQCFLHQRGVARFAGRIHEKLQADCDVGMLRNPLDHVTGQTIDERLKQMLVYADKEVEAICSKERPLHTGCAAMFWRPLRRLLRDVVLKRAYRDGVPGMAWAAMIAFRMFLIHFKYWQLHQPQWHDYQLEPTVYGDRPDFRGAARENGTVPLGAQVKARDDD